jgi:hypothetical protein
MRDQQRQRIPPIVADQHVGQRMSVTILIATGRARL